VKIREEKKVSDELKNVQKKNKNKRR